MRLADDNGEWPYACKVGDIFVEVTEVGEDAPETDTLKYGLTEADAIGLAMQAAKDRYESPGPFIIAVMMMESVDAEDQPLVSKILLEISRERDAVGI